VNRGYSMERLARTLIESKFFTILLGIFLVIFGIVSHNAGFEYEQPPIWWSFSMPLAFLGISLIVFIISTNKDSNIKMNFTMSIAFPWIIVVIREIADILHISQSSIVDTAIIVVSVGFLIFNRRNR
jgi:hypothetical protein